MGSHHGTVDTAPYDKDFLHDEYTLVASEPEKLPFLDRVVADSCSIGLYHTSGLSTPSQVFMALMSMSHLVHEGEEDPYIRLLFEQKGLIRAFLSFDYTEQKKMPPSPCGSEALLRLWFYYPKIFFRSSSGVLIGVML